MRGFMTIVFALAVAALVATSAWAHNGIVTEVPKLTVAPTLDGDISEWEHLGWDADGVWDLARIRQQAWNSRVAEDMNSGTEPAGTARTSADLSAEYFMAWTDDGLYLAVRATDNVHDVVQTQTVTDPAAYGLENDASLWPYKDSMAWYFDAPHHGERYADMETAEGYHVFAFVADEAHPATGTWWRHNGPNCANLDPLGYDVFCGQTGTSGWRYAVALDPATGTNYTIEAFVPFAESFQADTPDWRAGVGVTIGGPFIIHPDPDGQPGYGGQLMWGAMYDFPGFWADMTFVGPVGGGPVNVETAPWAEIKAQFR